MSVVSVDKDPDALTFTLRARFDATVERVWELWADPRRLERWWGPPTYPATVQEHDLTVGGTVTYFMTGPEGDRHHGWWRVTGVEAPRSLAFVDGFAHPDGTRNADLPETTVQVSLTARGAGTEMAVCSTFASREQMDQLLAMGMAEGMELAAGQMDALLVG